MVHGLLADLVVAVHLLFIAFVVGGELCILVGAARRWRWVRALLFRIAHVIAIVLVAAIAALGMVCPLTRWEWALRRRAGQTVEQDVSFVGRLVREIVYYELPERVFIVAYVMFALLVVITFVLVPPRRRARASRCCLTDQEHRTRANR